MDHPKDLLSHALPTVTAALPILVPRPTRTVKLRGHSRKRELEKLESQLMARIHYHETELVRLRFGCEHDWEDLPDAMQLHQERSDRLRKTLSTVRVALCN